MRVRVSARTHGYAARVPDPIVTTASGAVRGRSTGGVSAFKGIPYAAPPFGARRFAAPEPPEPWDGVRDAVEWGPTAPKAPYIAPYDLLLPEVDVPGEECLNLNVWTPDPDASGLPVMVWIHGGSFVNGSGSVPTYDGTAFARDGVVLVTLNYRLGAEGFLALDGAPQNRGLLDQMAALRWVAENIATFGGDRGNVTVFGESAGAMSVGALLASPHAEGLFRRAILQSGAGHHALSPPTAQRITRAVAERLGIAPERDAFAAVDPARLVQAQAEVQFEVRTRPDPAAWGEAAANLMAFEPVIDGDVLPSLPIERLAAEGTRGVDVMAGATTEEMRLFMVPNGVIDVVDENALAGAIAAYGLPADDARAAYARDGATPGDVLADIASDGFFVVPAIRLAEAAVAHGATAHVYEFAWRSPQYDGCLGACHALELGFVFDNLEAQGGVGMQGDTPPQALADAMHRAWVAFATSGDPGWAPYEPARRAVMRFDAHSAVVDDPRGRRRALWEGRR